MKKMTTKPLALTVAILLIANGLSAQEEKAETAAQVTFAYPIGSNGSKAKNTASHYSFNVLYGINGGVRQFELAGIGNQNHGNVQGAQLAGIVNITEGSSRGAIISGIANITTQSATGLHLTGIANCTNEQAKGAQIAGITNITNGTASGAFICGIANIHGGTTKGLMLSGIANTAMDDMTGTQIGLINAVNDSMNGFQLGFINLAKKMKGFQLGFINVSDSIDGVALGFMSIVKNGYYALEVVNNEVIHSNVSYKMGPAKLYNIYSVGYSRYNHQDVYSYGIGLGTLLPLGKRHGLAIEGVSHHIAYDDEWDELNILNKLNFNYQFHLNNHISFVGGPSLNFYITDMKVNGEYGTLDMPSPIWDYKGSSTGQFMWIGYNVGVNIRL